MTSIWFNRVMLQARHRLELTKSSGVSRDRQRQQSLQEQAAFYERIWREAAQTLGASCEPIGGHIAEIRLNGARTRVLANHTEMDSAITHALLREKPLVYEILKRHDLPVPDHAGFSLQEMMPAMAFIRSSFHACVVKPAYGAAGGGITTGVRNYRQLASAAVAASAYSSELLIEEQIAGDSYHLLYLDGQFIDALVRRPVTVCDGPAVDLTRSVFSAMNLLDSSIIKAGQRAVEALRVRFAGVDMVTTNPAVSLAESGGVILQVDSTPDLYDHYHKRDGAFPVAIFILRKLLGDDVPNRSRAFNESQTLFQGALV